MGVQVPEIHGTKYDDVINTLIEVVNEKYDSRFHAHAAAAIAKLLIAKHEIEPGAYWAEESERLASNVKIDDIMVGQIYYGLKVQIMRRRVIRAVVVAIALGVGLWLFRKMTGQ